MNSAIPELAKRRFSTRAKLTFVIALAVYSLAYALLRTGGTDAFDAAGLAIFRNDAGELPATKVVHFVRDFTALGGWMVLVWLTIVIASYFAITGRKRSARHVLGAMIGGIVLTYALKLGIGRERPSYAAAWNISSRAFPSGHASMSAVFYLTIGNMLSRQARTRGLRIMFTANAILLPLLIGLSRVYLGVHYPSDVFAGWALGIAWATLCWSVFRGSEPDVPQAKV